MKTMTESEWRPFLSFGTRTAKLASRRPDGRPHVAPIWFVLDANDLVFTTHSDSVKGKNLRHDPRIMLAVDDEQPPFAFVLVEGSATLSDLSPPELLPWTTRIAMRYRERIRPTLTGSVTPWRERSWFAYRCPRLRRGRESRINSASLRPRSSAGADNPTALPKIGATIDSRSAER